MPYFTEPIIIEGIQDRAEEVGLGMSGGSRFGPGLDLDKSADVTAQLGLLNQFVQSLDTKLGHYGWRTGTSRQGQGDGAEPQVVKAACITRHEGME